MQDEIIKSLTPLGPYSVFLYGSRGRGDHKENSDYEVGVVFEDEKVASRRLLHKTVNLDSVAAYPFKLSDVVAGNFNNPFTDSIFARELSEGGRTIYGEKIVENLSPPKITTLDLLGCVRFEIGCAFTAVLAHRNGEFKIASKEFHDACLYGLRLLIILEDRKFVCKFHDVYKRGVELDLNERYLKVIEDAYLVRTEEAKLRSDAAFDNLAFLDFVESEIIKELRLNGDSELV